MLFISTAYAQSPDQDVEKDSQMIFEALDRYVEGWMAKDANIATQDYAFNIHWVNEKGKVIFTKNSLVAFLEGTFSADDSNRPFPSLSHQITYLSPKIGVVHSMQTVKDQKSYHLRVFAKQGEAWKIINHLESLIPVKE